MNKRSTTIVRSAILNDFVYTILFNAEYSQKRGLMGKYLKAAMNQRTAKKFVAHSSRDEKEYVMSHLGFDFFYVVAKKGMTWDSMKGILEKFDSKKPVAAMKDIAQEGLCVMGNTEFIRLLGLMSKTIHHPTYFMNLEFQRQGYHIQRWGKRVNIEQDLQIREIDESARVFAKTCLNASVAMDYAQSTTGIGKTGMKIILYLYYSKQIEFDHEELFAHFSGNFSKTEYRYGLKELFGGEMIIRVREKVYSIAGAGMKAANQFLNSVNKLNEI